jgi:ketosteroid isomerase-like protein
MSLEEERAVVREAHLRWGEGDLDGFMSCFSDDVVHSVNVEGVPYASTAAGKAEMRGRLQLLLDTFVVDAFVIDTLVHEKDVSRSTVLGYYKHKKTGERLDVKLRFRAQVKDGLVIRLEEILDAAYIEAFERFVRYLEEAAQEAGGA